VSGLELRAVDRAIGLARDAGLDVPPEILRIKSHLEHGGAPPAWIKANPGTVAGCCIGEAVYGPARCTCWEPVFATEQAPPALPASAAEIEVRARRCGDCAFRKDSPERAETYTEEELLGLAAAGEPFWCHDGMRRPVAYRHPVHGDVPAESGDWQPATVGGVPFRADGRPGLLCAGWAQERRRQERLA
jgi:hypothetical protein